MDAIFIPTLGRIEKQLTWNMLPEWLREKTTLVVSPHELDSHRDRGRDVVSCSLQGNVARVRRWIVDYARAVGHKKIGVLDDDLTALVWTMHPSQWFPGLSWNVDGDDEDWNNVIAWIDRVLERTPLVGLASSTTPPHKDDESMPARLMQNHWYNLDLLPFNKLDWTGVEYAEDFHVALQLIGMGLPPIVNNRYRVAAAPTAAPGGCQTQGRNAASHNEAMLKLIELHSPWVRQSSRSRVGGEDWIKVTIRWQAYWKHVRQELNSR